MILDLVLSYEMFLFSIYFSQFVVSYDLRVTSYSMLVMFGYNSIIKK